MSSSATLRERRLAAVSRGVATAFPVFAQRAEGAELWDVDGKRYIDFAGGIGVLNTGHRHPKVLEAVARQSQTYLHTAFQVIAYEPYIAVCERLNALAPFDGTAKSILFSTGAEAVENAVKIARAATRRSAVIAFSGAFHGRTALTMGLTGKVAPYKRAFGLSPPGIYHLPFPSDPGSSVEQVLNALDLLFRADVAPTDVAAIIIEPVQGEGGFRPAPVDLLQALRRTCDAHGIVLIADEVQSGFARTGRMFGIEHSGIQPDLVTVAKSLAAGLPLSGVIGRAELMDAVEPGGLGGTYAGNPLACAAALAVLDVIADERLVERAAELGSRATKRLNSISAGISPPRIATVRGPGAMIAFDVVTHDGKPDAESARRVTADALRRGLILLTCGVSGNTIRLLFPLVITDELFEAGLNMLEESLSGVASGQGLRR
jgi:4-aminobutyrate aminotransferase / (S)-3-amino-2-methylpropionate transaminase / 5-aminovalerate transaminase